MARKPATKPVAAPSPADQGAASDEELAARIAAEAEAKAKAATDPSAGTDAEAKTPEGVEATATDEAEAGAGSEQRPAETVVVVSTAWALPEVTEFPVVLRLDNASPSSRSVASVGLYLAPNEQRTVEFDEVAFEKFARHIKQIAHLNGWKAGEGLLIEQEASDGED